MSIGGNKDDHCTLEKSSKVAIRLNFKEDGGYAPHYMLARRTTFSFNYCVFLVYGRGGGGVKRTLPPKAVYHLNF